MAPSTTGNKDYLKIQTTDNTHVLIRRDQITAIEDVPGTARSAPYLKLYAAGYSFNVAEKLEDFLSRLEGG